MHLLVFLSVSLPFLFSTAAAAEAEASNARKPANDAELRYWLENMIVYHHFSNDEIKAATGLTPAEIDAARRRFQSDETTCPKRKETEALTVLPYPGGRHPRIGFLDGAIHPQRETKVSVFTPWDANSYVVVDVPEAIWSNLGLLYLAHTHVPTVWTRQNVTLKPLEWNRRPDGTLDIERALPNRVRFGAKVRPLASSVRMELWLTNGSDATLSDLRVQMCVMLKAATGFNRQTNENKVLSKPYVACRSDDGKRWIITAWEPCHHPWVNPPVPCLHSDPKFPDCAPGETKRLRGWFSFYEGADVEAEFRRIDATGWKTTSE